jgi:hypothetical protein
MISIVFYDSTEYFPIIELFVKYDQNEISNYAYAASFNDLFGLSFKSSYFDWCNLSYGSCSILTFDFYDNETHSVSEYHYQVPRIACADSFTIGDEEW